MEARGIEPHTSANRKYLNAQDARIQALGPGSLPALCAFSALGALGKGQIRHNGDQSANSLCSSLAPDVTNQLNPPGAFTNWPCRGTPRRAVTCCASVGLPETTRDRKSTRLNSSHGYISYAVFCLKKKKKQIHRLTRCTTYQAR